MGMNDKHCCKCHKPLDSETTHCGSYCRKCKTEYQREYAKRTGYRHAKARHERLRQFIIEAKQAPCADCGNDYPWYVMDFDHRHGEKEFNLSDATHNGRSLETIKEEIAKCDVVCANCHRIRTFNDAASSNG